MLLSVCVCVCVSEIERDRVSEREAHIADYFCFEVTNVMQSDHSAESMELDRRAIAQRDLLSF